MLRGTQRSEFGSKTALMSRNAHNNKIGKITKYRRQFDDFYNFGKYGDCGEFLSNHQMYVNQNKSFVLSNELINVELPP